MYEGIFKDVDTVKEVLAFHGHKSVDKNLVFELLENLKSKDEVVKVLLGARVGSNSDSNAALPKEVHASEIDEPFFFSDNSYSSDELEILDDSSQDQVERCEQRNKTVESTMAENFGLPLAEPEKDLEKSVTEIPLAKELERQDDEKTVEVRADSTDKTEDVDGSESGAAGEQGKEEVCLYDDLKELSEEKSEDIDATNSATESEDVEMDDYYMRLDNDSEESVGLEWSVERRRTPTNLISLSPILRMQDEMEATNFDIRNNEESNLEPAENRMEEMLEENNNDPNNNLEDIQVLEQNNVSSTIQENSSGLEKDKTVEDKCVSPKPGCSKDSYYADSDVCFVAGPDKKNSAVTSSNNESKSSAVCDKASSSERRATLGCASWQLIDERMLSDFDMIKKVLPNTDSENIRSCLLKNREAINRVELTLWDLLPDERPLPIFSVKRKQEDGNPSSMPKKMYISSEESNSKTTSLQSKSSIIKPAKLNISEANKNIHKHPAKSAFANYRSSTSQFTKSLKSANSTLKLKPSSLQFVGSKNGGESVNSDPKKLQKLLKNQRFNYTSGVASIQEKSSVLPKSDELVPVIKKQSRFAIQNLPPVVVKESKIKSESLNRKNTGAIPKYQVHTVKEILSKFGKQEDIINQRIPKSNEPGSLKSRPEIISLLSKPSTSNIQDPVPGPKDDQMSGIAILEKEVKLLGEALAQQNASTNLKQEVAKLVQELKINTNGVVDPVVNFDVATAAPKANVSQAPKKVLPVVPPPEEKAKPVIKIPEKIKEPPKDLFNPLINMFPDVDPLYISDLCINAASTKRDLESLVNILLVEGTFHPRVINPEPEPQDINPDAQYENLQGIFPDAHPEYLRQMAERYYNDAEAMKNFVQSKLENPDYPTMADYLKKIKVTEQIKQYTVDFNPEKFLEIFPDPFKHFEDPKRVYRYNVIAFEFLKCHFRANKVATILKVYRHVNPPCHLSLAAKELERLGPDMRSRRADKLLPTEDIPLLQEIAFLQNKTEIREYMKEQTRKQKKEFKTLKANNALVECQCCFDGECMPSQCLTCSEGHIFCKSCIKLGSATKIGEGQTQFPCFVDCKGEFTLPVLQKVLEPTTFSILLRKRQEEEVKAAGLEGLVSCPFCHFASIPPPEDKVFKCLNPECMKESCRLCKELNHVPLRCDEVTKGEEARRYLEEKMTEALVRKCYQCSRQFFKDEGCNKMTCPCGATTCYICGERVKDYTHFNGQGNTRTDLCPLWSDNKVLNAQSVRIVAEAAEKEILKNNPHLKIDAKALMPALPQSTKGPHQDIANAHVLPVHIRRA